MIPILDGHLISNYEEFCTLHRILSIVKLIFNFKCRLKGIFSKNFKMIFIFKWLTKIYQ